jgi:hypothetical protein
MVGFGLNLTELLSNLSAWLPLLHISKHLHHRLRLLIVDPCLLQRFKGFVGTHHCACHHDTSLCTSAITAS